ncbi:MAG: S41 family peptidase [Bacteroidota bacterium]
MDWDSFAIYGVKRILEPNDDDFECILKELFSPIAPSLILYKGKTPRTNTKSSIKQLKGRIDIDTIQWQHIGNGQFKTNNTYKSKRVRWSDNTNFLFTDRLAFDSVFKSRLGLKIKMIMPMVLLADSLKTYPLTDKDAFFTLKLEMQKTKEDITNGHQGRELYIGNIVNLWNSIQHFYPYFEESNIKWDSIFEKMVTMYLKKPSPDSFFKVLEWGLHFLGDGHAKASYSFTGQFAIPIYGEWIENKMIVTNSSSPYLEHIGSEIISINGAPVESLIQEIKSYVPIGHVEEVMNDIASKMLIAKKIDVPFEVVLKKHPNKIDTLTMYSTFRTFNLTRSFFYLKNLISIREIEPELVYLNLDIIKYKEFEEALPSIRKAKNLIIDLRGYPNIRGDIFKFMGYFLPEDDSTKWLFKPNVIKPDRIDFMNSVTESGWTIKKLEPSINANIILIINHHAQSYAESVIGFFDKMENVTTVGSPTAGVNGNVNRFNLPGGYTYRYTGMKALKHDGSRLHGIGFLPDVEVRPTIQGIIEGRDEVLEKAIELTSANATANEVGKENKD